MNNVDREYLSRLYYYIFVSENISLAKIILKQMVIRLNIPQYKSEEEFSYLKGE